MISKLIKLLSDRLNDPIISNRILAELSRIDYDGSAKYNIDVYVSVLEKYQVIRPSLSVVSRFGKLFSTS
jgi:hypothetical protein